MRKRVLITVDWFDPAYRAGGPVTSIVNFVNLLHDKFEIFILTGDSDYGEVLLEGITTDQWINWNNKAQVYYVSKKEISRRNIFDILDETEADFHYIQGLFSLNFSIYPLLWWKKRKDGQGIVAPRGMLHETAIGIKSNKKLLYLNIAKFLGWFSDVYFHATNDFEKERVIKYFHTKRRVRVAANIPKVLEGKQEIKKQPGSLNVLMVGRISPEKNYPFLFEILAHVDFPVSIKVVGSYQDENYFEKEFDARIKQCKTNVSIHWLNALSPAEIEKEYKQTDVYLTTTKGENYGHSIIEALGNGCPVIAPIEIPWQKLSDYGAGINLEWKPEEFARELKKYYNMDQNEFSIHAQKAFDYYQRFTSLEQLKEEYEHLFT